ncbi:hypothetical protein [Caldimonas brevitalea]|uniref:Uncharacterized protein n=1 Tax=Caldimonas brevitalea TaxID=413882 RepID=A0A0G3BUH4_9BURK|nr:hypothetical protein [Caldimonas brevitalea]AKJ30185.1 hypothetical protein AAW51_3494 [Caldimonas brevitalea]
MTDRHTLPHTPHALDDIKRRVQDTIGDAPELLKLALENVLRDLRGAEETPLTTAGRIGRQAGTVSELTLIAPVRPGGAERLRRILKLVNGNFSGAQKVGTLHDMRFVFLEHDTKLLFATTYDGDWDAYIDDFSTQIPDLMDLVFASVEGWPGIKDPGVKDFIAQHQLPADGWYVAHPDLTVADVRELKRLKAALDEFLDKIA